VRIAASTRVVSPFALRVSTRGGDDGPSTARVRVRCLPHVVDASDDPVCYGPNHGRCPGTYEMAPPTLRAATEDVTSAKTYYMSPGGSDGAVGTSRSAPLRSFDVRTSFGGVFTDAAAYNKRVRLLWIGAGTGETTFIEAAGQLHKALDAAGVRHVMFESPGTAHEWQTWRRSLHDFAPRLFK